MAMSPNSKSQPRTKSYSPVKSKFNTIRVTSTVENCPVSDPSLRIISENDHRVGMCICKFCECGQHICPNPLIKELYPSSTFTSKYKADYKKGDFDLPLKPEPKAYRPSTFKMDLRTTNQEDFKPFSVSPKKSEYRQILPAKLNSPKRSAYCNDFLN